MNNTILLKNLVLREKYFKYENYKRLNKFLFINLLNNPLKKKFRSKILFKLLAKKEKLVSKSQIKNQCLLTGRNKAVNKQYSISRILFRNMLQFGIIPGYKKSVW